jgi:transcription termination factor NusB
MMPTFTSFIRRHDSNPGRAARLLIVAGALFAAALAQEPGFDRQAEHKRLPGGKLQSEEILKADHEANLKDLESMQRMITGVLDDLKKNDRHVLSVQSIRQLEEIEKSARRVRGRMQRF